MSDPSPIYGPSIDAEDVHQAVTDFVTRWFPSYIAEIGARKGFARTKLETFASMTNVDALDKWPEHKLPALITFIPGTDRPPTRNGDGSYDATWPLGLGVVVKGKDRDSTYRLLMAYMSALRMLFLQHGSIDGFAESTTWEGDDYDQMPFDAGRTIRAGIVSFVITVSDVVSTRHGVSTPPEDATADPGPGAIVEQVDIDVRGMR